MNVDDAAIVTRRVREDIAKEHRDLVMHYGGSDSQRGLRYPRVKAKIEALEMRMLALDTLIVEALTKK